MKLTPAITMSLASAPFALFCMINPTAGNFGFFIGYQLVAIMLHLCSKGDK